MAVVVVAPDDLLVTRHLEGMGAFPLLAAKKAVASLGGSERALEAIHALKRLEG